MVGTINLDYHSMVHHFENGVWMHHCTAVERIKEDFEATFPSCIPMTRENTRWNLPLRFIRAVLKVFAPLL